MHHSQAPSSSSSFSCRAIGTPLIHLAVTSPSEGTISFFFSSILRELHGARLLLPWGWGRGKGTELVGGRRTASGFLPSEEEEGAADAESRSSLCVTGQFGLQPPWAFVFFLLLTQSSKFRYVGALTCPVDPPAAPIRSPKGTSSPWSLCPSSRPASKVKSTASYPGKSFSSWVEMVELLGDGAP